MDDAEEDDENANRSNSKSLSLHPDKSVLENEEPDPVKIKKVSESLKFPIDELKARLKKLKQDEAEDASNMNVIFLNVFIFLIFNILIRIEFYNYWK